MGKVIYNKNVSSPSEIVDSLFTVDDHKYGEIVICDSITEPGLYIYTRGVDGTAKIQKINSVENIFLDQTIDQTATGTVVMGDTLVTMVSKLQNQINEQNDDTEELSGSTQNIIIGVGLNEDGTFKAFTEEHVASAETIYDAVEALSVAIDEALDSANSHSEELVQAEEDRAVAAESALSQSILEENERALNAESALTQLINDETERATEAELELTSSIMSETSRASSAETALAEDIASETQRAEEAEAQISGVLSDTIETLGINEDGSFSGFSGTHLIGSETIVDALENLNDAIDTGVEESKNYTDNKVDGAISSLQSYEDAEDGSLVTGIRESNGIVTTVTKELTIEHDETGLLYSIKLGDYVCGEVNIPKDQFLKSANFIASATIADATEAMNAGQEIVLGRPYLRFVWELANGVVSPTFVDVNALVDVYNAKDIKLSEEYSNNEFGITSGKSLEEVVSLMTDEIVSIEADVQERSMNSTDGTVIISKSSSGTNLSVNIDNDTIVKSELVSGLGVLSSKLTVDKESFDSGNVKTKYTLRSENGEYGVINDTRDIIFGDAFVTVTTRPTINETGVRTDSVEIELTTQDVIENAEGPEEVRGNGLVTAWGIKNYVKNEVNGHVIMVGNEDLIDDRDYEYWRGKINFNELSADYDSIHGALLKTDNNFQVLDETIGLPISGRSVHQYPSAMTENATVIKDDRTIMSALVSLDSAIGGMDWTGLTNDNEVFDAIRQDNGNLSATARNLTSVKIGGYEVEESAKLAETDTLGEALGKLQGQIDALDWTGTTNDDEVFSIITEADGKLSAGTRSISSIKISDYEVLPSEKLSSTDTIGLAFGKVQGQINAMDWTGVTDDNEVFSVISEADGVVSAAARNLTSVKLAGYSATADTKVDETQTLGQALGNLQGQINSMDLGSSASEQTVVVGVSQVDGKVSAEYRQVSQTKIDNITTADTKVSNGDTIAVAVGKLQGQINSMDKPSVADENSIIYDVTEVDGVVSSESRLLTSIKLSGLTESASGKISDADTLGTALVKLQSQMNGLDWTGVTANDTIFTAITQDDGVLSAKTALATSRVMTGYAVGSDAKLAATDTLGGALGKLQGQINAMDKAASSETGKFVRTVSEADGKVSETRGYLLDTDITIATAATSSVNIREAFKLVNGEGTQLGSTINIYKDQTLKSVVLSGDSSTTGQWLVFTYILADGTESKVSIDVSKFLVQAEFKSGVTADSTGVVHGVVDSTSESFLSVGANGFKLSGVQNAINAAIDGLDSTATTTNTGYALTSVTITNGKITAKGETSKVHSATTAGHADAAAKVDSQLSIHYGATGNTDTTFDGTTGRTINIPNNTNQLANGANFITTAATVANAQAVGGTSLSGLLTAFSSTTGTAPTTSVAVGGTVKTANINADTIDGYHIVVGSTGTTNNTIYIL